MPTTKARTATKRTIATLPRSMFLSVPTGTAVITIPLTHADIQQLREHPVSVSRILKGAASLLDEGQLSIDEDQGVTADYLRSLEPLLNRLFAAARECLVGRKDD